MALLEPQDAAIWEEPTVLKTVFMAHTGGVWFNCGREALRGLILDCLIDVFNFEAALQLEWGEENRAHRERFPHTSVKVGFSHQPNGGMAISGSGEVPLYLTREFKEAVHGSDQGEGGDEPG